MIKDLKRQKVHYNPFRGGLVEKAIPATLSQREMWSTLVLEPEANICYNEVICMEVSGKLSTVKLEAAFQEVLKRHEALRATFSQDGKYFVVHQYQYQKITIESIKSADLKKYQQEAVSKPFDLVNGPLAKIKVLKESENRHFLIFSAHHIVCDGWSLAIILTELTRAYEEISLGAASSFVEFALRENREGVNQSDRNYWLNLFEKPFEGNQLPLDFSRPKYRTFDSNRFDLDVSSELVVRLKKFSAKNRISFYTLLMGGFSLLLKQLSGKRDIVVGMATAAQSIPGNEEVVGHLVNMLPIRSRFSENEKVSDYLQNLKKSMMDGIDHQCYTFGSLLQDLNIPRNPSEIPIINVVFNIDQQLSNQGLEFAELKASYQSVPRLKENFEIFINAVSRDQHLTIECQYNKNLFRIETIKNWLENYCNLLDIITRSEMEIEEISLPQLVVPKAVAIENLFIEKNIFRDSETEKKLCLIWKELLQKDIGVKDNFFSKGGHSLLVVEMIQKIELVFNKKISVREIFENPTIEELSSILAKHEIQKVEKIIPVKKQDDYPVSPAQMQVWYLEEIFKSTPMHNLPASIDLHFEVDKEALEETLNVLIKRHESLRSIVKVKDGLPVTQIMDAPRFILEEIKTNLDQLQNELNKLACEVIPTDALYLFKAKLLCISPNHYVFFFMPHHMIWDGWSFDIFFEELNLAYTALVNKKVPQFKSEVLINYKDYSTWLNKQINDKKLIGEKEFWVEKLKLPLPLLNLTAKNRPSSMSHEGQTFSFTLDRDLAQGLEVFCLDHGVSLYNVILTAFKLTLACKSNLADIIVGTPVRCRNFPELLNVIGYFVNTVALRTQIDPKKDFLENLKEVMKTSVEAFDHSQLPFQEVMKVVKFPRDPSRTPIYQTFFSYQDVSNRKPELAGHEYRQINIEKNSTHTDLDLWVKASKNKVEGAFEYRAEIFEPSWIASFYQSFSDVLKEVVSPVKVKDKDTAENKSTAFEWDSIVKLFERNVLLHGDKVAIKNDSSRLSYSALNSRANIYANALIKQGIQTGSYVGIALSRHIELLPALLGILKTGAAYVPLDPAFPQDRLDYMIENSKIKFLITESKHAQRFPQVQTVLIENVEESSASCENPNIPFHLDSSAYVIYTSGSTGKPKGVEISHKSLANFLLSMSETPGMNSRDRLLAVTTLSFDIAGLELFLPLVSGASIYLANQFDAMDGGALRDIIEKNSINYMQATPSTWRLLLAAGWKGDPSFKILCGGEAFPKDLAFKLIPMVDSVWNMYGPTETTIWSTCKKLNLTDVSITVGNAIANTTLYILDENKNILPTGAEGELYIGGLGVAKGYYNRPDLTEERFIAHPHSSELIYATGDLARINQFGELEVLGRLDGQVKVRGYRIELGEIEAQLNMYSGVNVSAAITKEVTPGDARIIAFVVVGSNTHLDEEALRLHLTTVLPRYMIPSHFVFIDKMPQTLNGKIDKKTLGTMFNVSQEETVETKIHSPQIEEMRTIWQKVLGVKSLSDKDNFFDIGGNSLLAVELSNKVAKHFGSGFQLRTLLENSVFIEFSENYFKQFKQLSTELGATRYLVTMRKQGTQTPIFCVHQVGGNVLNYTQLLPAIENRPVYGIQSAGLAHPDHPGTVEGLASLYIKEMKLVQPQGPYILAGGSMGGMIAYEIAQQLKREGESISKLILFDTFGPNFDVSKYKNEEASSVENFKTMLAYYVKRFVNKAKQYVFDKLGAEHTLEMKLFDLEVKNYQTLWKYRPEPYDGDVHLYRNEMKEKGWYADPYLGWRKTIQGNIHTHLIKAHHSEFIESEELLDVLKKTL